VKSWTEGERVTKASDIWSESRCSSGIRRREREQPITHWEEKEWRSPLSLSEATTCEWCVKKRDEDFFLTVRRCIVVICTVVQFLSVCGMHPTTIHHEYTRPVTTASDHDEEARVWMKDCMEKRIFKMSVWCYQGMRTDPLNQLKFRRSTCGRTNNWEECVKLLSENSTHLCTIACNFYQSYECHSRFQHLSQCNSTLSLEPLLTASVSTRWRKTGE